MTEQLVLYNKSVVLLCVPAVFLVFGNKIIARFIIIYLQRYNIWTLIPSDPGDYEVRFRVSNGFQWSAYSTPVSMKQYDTDRWIKKGAIWWAVPDWKKTAGTMQLVRK